MPKTKLEACVKAMKAADRKQPTNIPPPNYLSELFRRYMKAQKLSAAAVGKKLNCTGQNVTHMINRDVDQWKCADVAIYAAVINCPLNEAYEAVCMSQQKYNYERDETRSNENEKRKIRQCCNTTGQAKEKSKSPNQ